MELKMEKITKMFKDKLAVNKVDITLTSGIWGLLGANGAGKTTLIRMLADIMKPTEGRILYNNEDIHGNSKYRDIFGYLPQEFSCSREFSIQDYLEYMAALKGLDKTTAKVRIDEMLEVLTLTEVRSKKVVKLSGGMRRRVGIAQAMLNNPEVLVLDEPTAGLDPGERVRFRNFISEFAKSTIVLISTHIVSDIEYISTKNAIMKDGRILDVGTTEELTEKIRGNVWNAVIHVSELPDYEVKLRIINRKHEKNSMVFVRYISDKSEIPNSKLAEPNLEDLYLWLFPDNKE